MSDPIKVNQVRAREKESSRRRKSYFEIHGIPGGPEPIFAVVFSRQVNMGKMRMPHF